MSPEQSETFGAEPWRPEKETKSQREWKPGQKKKQRSIFELFTSTVLLGEAFVLAFFGLMLYGLYQHDNGLWFLIGSLVLAVLAAMASRLVKKPAGVALGWIIQAVLIASGFLEPLGFLVGIAFALVWWYAVVKGRQIDVENIRRAKEQQAWEQEHGTDIPTD